MNIIGHILTDFPTKFGIPRQSGLIDELKGVIIFEPEYRQPEAFRGLEDFSHIWVLWQFSKSQKKTIAATVTPPRLGGKYEWECLQQGRRSDRMILGCHV